MLSMNNTHCNTSGAKQLFKEDKIKLINIVAPFVIINVRINLF